MNHPHKYLNHSTHTIFNLLGVTMNKLPLVLAVSLIAASSSLSAATIYEKDGFKFKMDGDIQIQLRKRTGSGEETHVDIDDSELKNKISYDLGNDLTAFAEAHFDTGKDVDGAVESEETFVGIKSKNFKIQIGRMDYVTDDFATERGIEEPTNESAFEAGDTSGTDVILMEAKAGPMTFALSHDLGDSSRNTELSSTDIYVSGKVNSNLQFGAAFQSLKEDATSDATRTSGINAELKIGKISVAADYSSRDDKHSDASLADLKVTNLSVAFPIAATTKTTLGITSQSNKSDTAADSWYANIVYKFPKAKNVSIFAEIENTNEQDSNMGFVAGMRVKF